MYSASTSNEKDHRTSYVKHLTLTFSSCIRWVTKLVGCTKIRMPWIGFIVFWITQRVRESLRMVRWNGYRTILLAITTSWARCITFRNDGARYLRQNIFSPRWTQPNEVRGWIALWRCKLSPTIGFCNFSLSLRMLFCMGEMESIGPPWIVFTPEMHYVVGDWTLNQGSVHKWLFVDFQNQAALSMHHVMQCWRTQWC